MTSLLTQDKCVSAAFISLLDNYVSDTGEPEIVTPEEVAENHKFLDSIVKSPTMKVPVENFCPSLFFNQNSFGVPQLVQYSYNTIKLMHSILTLVYLYLFLQHAKLYLDLLVNGQLLKILFKL